MTLPMVNREEIYNCKFEEDMEVHALTSGEANGSEIQKRKKGNRGRNRGRKRKASDEIREVRALDRLIDDKLESGEKTILSEVTAGGKKLSVTITKEGLVVQEWILRQTGKDFGLDIEWRPNFMKNSMEHKAALLQISGDTECMIVQMLYLDSIPLALVNFLKDPRITLHGVGISGDAKKLKKDWGLKIKGVVDLGILASITRGQQELKNAGLRTLAKVVINFDMDKPKRVTMSNWAKCDLDRIQVEYASLDAWVGYAIFQGLVKCKNLSMDTK